MRHLRRRRTKTRVEVTGCVYAGEKKDNESWETNVNRQQHTHFQLFSEDCPLAERRTIPAPVPELKLTLVDAHLGALSDDDNGIGATLADYPLSGGQTRDLVTDYART